MSFKCDKCNKVFGFKHHLNNHLNKKKYLTSLIQHKKTHINYDEEIKKLYVIINE